MYSSLKVFSSKQWKWLPFSKWHLCFLLAVWNQTAHLPALNSSFYARKGARKSGSAHTPKDTARSLKDPLFKTIAGVLSKSCSVAKSRIWSSHACLQKQRLNHALTSRIDMYTKSKPLQAFFFVCVCFQTHAVNAKTTEAPKRHSSWLSQYSLSLCKARKMIPIWSLLEQIRIVSTVGFTF